MAVIEFSFLSKDGQSIENAVIIDAALSEASTYAADVTMYPVETGSDVSDNIRAKPLSITVEGIISDFPLKASGGAEIPGAEGRSKNAVDDLRQMQEEGVLCTLHTGPRVLRNMALESFSFTRTKDTKNGLQVTLNFKQVRTTKLVEATIRVVESRAKSKVSKGAQTAKPVPEEKAKEVRKSLATSIGQSVFLLDGFGED